MKKRQFHVLMTAVYAALITIIYTFEISAKWGYLGFPPPNSYFGLMSAIAVSMTYALFLSTKFDTRSFFLSVIHYLYFVPSIIFLGATEGRSEHLLAVIISYAIIIGFSLTPIRSPSFLGLPRSTFLILVFIFLSLAVFLIAFYGGLRNFNLNIFSVYEFRRETAANMPEIFGYITSSVPKVVAPLAIVLSLYYRNAFLLFISVAMVVLLFGMTHHKSVVFLAMAVALFYWFLSRYPNLRVVAYIFMGVAVVSLVEIAALSIIDDRSSGVFNSYIVRRGIFIPPLIDSFYLEFFADKPKFYWSTSRLGLGLADNPYGQSAPFLIGVEYFGNADTSANTGVIGSGFSHAGLYGVAFYAALAGLLLAAFQAYGRMIGHAFVSAGTFSVFVSVVVSTDFSTALLTHGLVLLALLLALFPREQRRVTQISETSDVDTFYNRSPAH